MKGTEHGSGGDAELVRRTLRGDACAYAALVDRYREVACATAYYWLGDAEDARDAAQEAFIAVYGRLGALREPARFGAYLRRAVVNQCAGQLRHRREAPLTLPDAADDSGPPLEEAVIRRLTTRRALATLSPKIRFTLTLCYWGGYSHAETAALLGVPVGTVRSRLRHAKRQLREEMLKMAEETMQEARPGPGWSRQVVEAALRRGADALGRHDRGEAAREYDAALAELGGADGGDAGRLRIDALRRKADAVRFASGATEAVELLEEASNLAESVGDYWVRAGVFQDLGNAYGGAHDRGRAEERYRAALDLYRSLADPLGQAECLVSLAAPLLQAGDAAGGRRLFAEALPLFEQANAADWVGVCHAQLALLDAVGAERLPDLLLWRAVCGGLDRDGNGRVRFGNQPGFIVTRSREGHPPALYLGDVFWQMAHLCTLLDPAVPASQGWSGDAFSFSLRPLHATVTVLSDAEPVATPAGAFDRCLLIEQVTTTSDGLDDASEQAKALNAAVLCGTRRAWYAPSVGLVRLEVNTAAGATAVVELARYSVADGSSRDYLPLAAGNTWEYAWSGLPPGYEAAECYRVTGRSESPSGDGERWHVAQWAYARRNV